MSNDKGIYEVNGQWYVNGELACYTDAMVALQEENESLRNNVDGRYQFDKQRTIKLEEEIQELDRLVGILTMGSNDDALEALGASFQDACTDRRTLAEAIRTIVDIVKDQKGEGARMIRDVLKTAMERAGEVV